MTDKKYLKVSWKLPRSKFTKTYNWKLAEAIQDSLSIVIGQNISLLKREVYCGVQQRFEIRRPSQITDLDIFSLFNVGSSLNKGYFIKLIDFLAKDERGSDICRNIFQQLIRAARQENWHVRELLVSTILEAALRNIDGQPFQAGKGKPWNVGKSLQNFINSYLSNEWHGIKASVMKAHEYLRNRNAHPDWLFTQGGALSNEEMEKSLDSMIFLSRFYGYMILALAGIKDLKPRFPKPHSEWGAAIIIKPS
jgi:hypothetical protein